MNDVGSGVSDSGGVGVNEDGGVGVLYIPSGRGELHGEFAALGFSRFSFCRRLQNQTLTTSFSMQRPSLMYCTSSLVGLGLLLNARSSATRMVLSMLVRFLRRRASASWAAVSEAAAAAAATADDDEEVEG